MARKWKMHIGKLWLWFKVKTIVWCCWPCKYLFQILPFYHKIRGNWVMLREYQFQPLDIYKSQPFFLHKLQVSSRTRSTLLFWTMICYGQYWCNCNKKIQKYPSWALLCIFWKNNYFNVSKWPKDKFPEIFVTKYCECEKVSKIFWFWVFWKWDFLPVLYEHVHIFPI